MRLPETAAAALEQAIAGLLKLDPISAERLAELHGKVIAIELTGVGLMLYLIPDARGHLQILQTFEGEPDCSMQGSPLDLMRSGDPGDQGRQLFQGRVQIRGNAGLAQRFGAILGDLDVDWEEPLSKVVGDPLAHQVGRTVRGTSAYLGNVKDSFEQNLGEYLTEETQLLPTRFEFEQFRHEVRESRELFDRLEARERQLRKVRKPS